MISPLAATSTHRGTTVYFIHPVVLSFSQVNLRVGAKVKAKVRVRVRVRSNPQWLDSAILVPADSMPHYVCKCRPIHAVEHVR